MTVALTLAPSQIRTLRASLITALESEYVDAARARGVSETRITLRHALPNAIGPMVAVIAVQAGLMLFADVVVENTFQLAGLGQGMVLAVGLRDYPVVLGITLVFAIFVVLVNLVADMVIIFVDPRSRS